MIYDFRGLGSEKNNIVIRHITKTQEILLHVFMGHLFDLLSAPSATVCLISVKKNNI